MYVVKVVKNLHLDLKLITKIEITNILDVFTYFHIPYLYLLHSTAFGNVSVVVQFVLCVP